jgi:acyl-CoA thioester hydrolase
VTDAFRHRTPLQVRFRDTDAFGHVNTAVFATYAELARVRYLLDVLQPAGPFQRQPLILAHLAIDFRSPIELGEEVMVETAVERIGRTSIGMAHRMTAGADGRLAADVASVIVVYDYASARPIPVPDEWRARIGAFENRAFETDPSRREPAAAG